jgi:hypothetical protein
MGKTFRKEVDRIKPSKWDKKRTNKKLRYDRAENSSTNKDRQR